MLIQTDVGRAEVVAKQLAELAGVRPPSTSPVRMTWWRASPPTPRSELQNSVVPTVQQVAGITRTLTCPIAAQPDPRVALVASTADDSTDGPPRALLIAAIAVAVGAIVAVLAVAACGRPPRRRTRFPSQRCLHRKRTAPNALR